MLKRLCLSLRFVISFGSHSIKMGGGGGGGKGTAAQPPPCSWIMFQYESIAWKY